MTGKWSKADLAHLDALLAKFPLTEIDTKARRRPRRSAGRPEYDDVYKTMLVFFAIEVIRKENSPLTVAKAANKLAKRLGGKPSSKTLQSRHREYERRLPSVPNELKDQATRDALAKWNGVALEQILSNPEIWDALKKTKPKNSG